MQLENTMQAPRERIDALFNDPEPSEHFGELIELVRELIEADELAEELLEDTQARVRELWKTRDFAVERASHWTNANYTKLLCPFSVRFSGERLFEVSSQTSFGFGLARTLRMVADRRWDKKLGVRHGKGIAAMEALSQLEGIEIAEQSLGPKGVNAFASSPHLTSLRALSITGCKSGHEGAAAIANNPALANLEILILSQGRIESAGAEALARSPHLTKLHTLVLDENQLGAAALRAIAESESLANLRYLTINSNKNIGADGVVALANSPHLRSLETLHLRGVNMRTTGATALANSPILSTVKELSLFSNNITEKGKQALRESTTYAGPPIF